VNAERCEKSEQRKQMSETFVAMVLDRVTRGREIR
jgi:hypothetical protein